MPREGIPPIDTAPSWMLAADSAWSPDSTEVASKAHIDGTGRKERSSETTAAGSVCRVEAFGSPSTVWVPPPSPPPPPPPSGCVWYRLLPAALPPPTGGIGGIGERRGGAEVRARKRLRVYRKSENSSFMKTTFDKNCPASESWDVPLVLRRALQQVHQVQVQHGMHRLKARWPQAGHVLVRVKEGVQGSDFCHHHIHHHIPRPVS